MPSFLIPGCRRRTITSDYHFGYPGQYAVLMSGCGLGISSNEYEEMKARVAEDLSAELEHRIQALSLDYAEAVRIRDLIKNCDGPAWLDDFEEDEP